MPFYDGMGIYNKVETAAQKKMFHVLTMCSWQTCGTQNT